jgi:hypothetical protein
VRVGVHERVGVGVRVGVTVAEGVVVDECVREVVGVWDLERVVLGVREGVREGDLGRRARWIM